ncbi:MAG: hypothetical protein Q9M39_07975 [Sulfurovum sp.]|nr:hypothetical protein [Sulfurovum sp.]
MEGARKIVLFFNVGFFYKVLLSLGIVYFIPEDKVSDYFGFGYLLSTLIAVKMYDKISIPLFTRTTLQTSLISIFIATVIGYTLTLLPEFSLFYTKPNSSVSLVKAEKDSSNLITYLEKQKIYLYGKSNEVHIQKPTPSELGQFEKVLTLIDEGYEKHSIQIQMLLSALHYKIMILQERYLILSQVDGYYVWGLYIIDLKEKNKLLIEVPYPLETSNIMESAVLIMKLSNAKVLSISGVPFAIERKLASDIFNNYYSIYHTVHKHYAKDNVVQIRALNNALHKELFSNILYEESVSTLFVQGYMPKAFKLARLKILLPSLNITWDDKTESSIQKTVTHNGFAELYLTEKDRLQLISSEYYFKNNLNHKSSLDTIEGLLNSWVLDKKLEISKKNSGVYIAPNIQELLFFDNTVFTPIYNILNIKNKDKLDIDSMKLNLYPIAIAAKSLGYTLTWYDDVMQGKSYIILHEVASRTKRYWGTYIFKVGEAENIAIQTPRPFHESNTFESSLVLFVRLNAKVLLLSGTHPLTNTDGSADVIRFENKRSIFSLLSQVLYRESKDTSMNVLQVRGMKQNLISSSPKAILALHKVFENRTQLNDEEQLIYDYLQKYIPIGINDGSIESAGYNAQAIQSQYLKQSLNNTFNILWLPASLRRQYRQATPKDMLMQQFKTLGIDVRSTSFIEYIETIALKKFTNYSEDVFLHLTHYLTNRDISELESLYTNENFELEVIVDIYNLQSYLFVYQKLEKKFIGIIKLNAEPPYDTVRIECDDTIFKEQIEEFYSNLIDILRVEDTCVK